MLLGIWSQLYNIKGDNSPPLLKKSACFLLSGGIFYIFEAENRNKLGGIYVNRSIQLLAQLRVTRVVMLYKR